MGLSDDTWSPLGRRSGGYIFSENETRMPQNPGGSVGKNESTSVE